MVQRDRRAGLAAQALERRGGDLAHADVIGMAVGATRIERDHGGRAKPPDLAGDPVHDLRAIREDERARLRRPVLHPGIPVAQEDRLSDAQGVAGAAQLVAPDLRVHRMVALLVSLPALVAVRGTDEPRRLARGRRQREHAAGPERLVVRMREDREQAPRPGSGLTHGWCLAHVGRVVTRPRQDREPWPPAARRAPRCAGTPPRRPPREPSAGAPIPARGGPPRWFRRAT